MFLHYHPYKTKTHKSNFFANANKSPLQIFFTSSPLGHSPHPLHSTYSFSTSTPPTHNSIRQRRIMHLKQSPYQLQPQQFLSSSSSFFSTLCSTSKETTMSILWYVSNENKSYSEKYEWASLLLLSEVSISTLPSHSCLHVQELHTTQTDKQTDRQTHTHTHNIYIYIL